MKLEPPLLEGFIMKHCPQADLLSGGQGLLAAFNVIVKPEVQMGVVQGYHSCVLQL